MAGVAAERIMVAPNGARRGKADHPALPVTAGELAAVARDCSDAGAGAIHVHVRDAAGLHSLDAGLYAEAMAEIAVAAPAMRIQITTESAGRFDIAAQEACLEAVAPRWASIARREMAVDEGAAARIYAACAERNTEVQHILYAPEELDQLLAWAEAGVIPVGPLSVIFVLGSYAGTEAVPRDLDAFLARPGIDTLADWTVCAFGRAEQACLLAALKRGGRARIGFENNLWHPDGTLLRDNAEGVQALVEAAKREL